MWYVHTLEQFSSKKEGNSDTYYNMDEPWHKPVTKKANTAWFHLYEIARVVKFKDRSRMMVDRGREEAMGSCLMRAEFLLQDKKSSGDWLYNNMNILNTTDL